MKNYFFLILHIIYIISTSQEAFCNKYLSNFNKEQENYDSTDLKIYSIYLNSNYSTNTNFLGYTNIFVNQPSYNFNLEFLTPFNFELGTWLNGIENSNDSLNQLTYDYGFNVLYDLKLFKKKLIITPAYTRFFYSKNSSTIRKFFDNNFSIDVELKLKKSSLGITGSYLIGTNETFQLTLFNTFIFEKKDFLFKNTLFSYAPSVIFLFDQLDYLNQYYFKTYPYLMLKYLERRDYYEILWLKRRNPSITKEEIIEYLANKKSDDKFHITTIAILFPFTYLIKNFGININISLIIPAGYPDYFDKSIQYILEGGISYLISF